jgi:hypothetical protein
LRLKNSLPLALGDGIMNIKQMALAQIRPRQVWLKPKTFVYQVPLAKANGNK